MFWQFFLAGNSVEALHLAARVFLAGNDISEKQQAEKQKGAREKKR